MIMVYAQNKIKNLLKKEKCMFSYFCPEKALSLALYLKTRHQNYNKCDQKIKLSMANETFNYNGL